MRKKTLGFSPVFHRGKSTKSGTTIEISQNYDEIISLLSEKGYELKENYSNYSLETNPCWDGSHNDFLFCRKQAM